MARKSQLKEVRSMAHMPKRNKEQERQNELRFLFYKRHLTDLWFSLFKCQLPFDETIHHDVERWLNLILFEGNEAALFYHDILGFLLGRAEPIGSVNWFNRYNNYRITLANGKSFQRNIGEIAICRNTPLNVGMSFIISWYARLLADVAGALDVNLKGQHTPAIIRSPSGQELTYSNMYEQVAGHKPVVFGLEFFNEDGKNFVYQEPAVYLGDKLYMLKNAIYDDFYGMFGLSHQTNEKKAQINNAEIGRDQESRELNYNVFNQPRQEFVNQGNALFYDTGMTNKQMSFELNMFSFIKFSDQFDEMVERGQSIDSITEMSETGGDSLWQNLTGTK